MAHIKYTCKNCGWETSIREEWGDLKPQRCMNKRCNVSFRAKPDMLDIQVPEVPKEESKGPKHAAKSKRQEVVKADE